jgi:hypothetical protein
VASAACTGATSSASWAILGARRPGRVGVRLDHGGYWSTQEIHGDLNDMVARVFGCRERGVGVEVERGRHGHGYAMFGRVQGVSKHGLGVGVSRDHS